VAIQMALLAIAQAMGLIIPSILGWEYSAGFFGLGVLGLAGISLLLANHSLGAPGFNLAGVGCMVLDVLGSQSLWWHNTPLIALWLGNPRYQINGSHWRFWPWGWRVWRGMALSSHTGCGCTPLPWIWQLA
jgi:hypothetical protein